MKLCNDLKGELLYFLSLAKENTLGDALTLKYREKKMTWLWVDLFLVLILKKNLFDFRNLLGEDLGPLTIKELEQLERQLDVSLRQIKSTRVTNRHYFLY